MSRVDFYILPEQRTLEHFVCSIAEEYFRQGERVFIHTLSDNFATKIDELLWTYSDTSFLPHGIYPDESEAPILIGNLKNFTDNRVVVINLSDQMPTNNQHIIEIVSGNKAQRQQARDKYATYRDEGHELHHHHIQD